MRLQMQLVCLSMLFCFTFNGCDSSTPAPPSAGGSSTTATTASVIPGASLDRLKAELEGYTSSTEVGATKFERQLGSHKIELQVRHNDKGEISSVSGFAKGPTAETEGLAEAFATMLDDVLNAFGIKDNSAVQAHREIALWRLNAGYGYDFRHDDLGFFMIPDRKSGDDGIERGVSLVKSKSVAGGATAIPGASIDEFKELLSGFETKATVEGEAILFVRELDTHKQVILAYIDETGAIRRLESFLADVKDAENLQGLRRNAWAVLGDLKYEGAEPTKAKEFIMGPKMPYAAGDGRDIGSAVYFSNVDMRGERSLFEVFPTRKRAE
jgi:hypothetical protein